MTGTITTEEITTISTEKRRRAPAVAARYAPALGLLSAVAASLTASLERNDFSWHLFPYFFFPLMSSVKLHYVRWLIKLLTGSIRWQTVVIKYNKLSQNSY
jgi:hypothetical protein